jgi:hypothetical protein
MENWRGFLVEKELRGQKDKRVMYHIGRRPASPKPAERWGEKGGWTRSWMDGPVPSGVFMTPNPTDVVQHHGVSGNVYAYKVPEWVIAKAGGKQRYDSAGELLISQEIWDEAGDEIEFLGKTMDQNDLWDTVDHSITATRSGAMRSKRRPDEVSISGIAGHRNAEEIIKMLTSREKQQLMAQLEDKYPEALKGDPFEVEWEKVPGERKGYRKDFRLGEPRLTKNHQELLDLLKKHMTSTNESIMESWRKFNEEEEPVDRPTIEQAIEDFSFNSAQGSQHRWGSRQPIIDYYFDERIDAWKYKAAIPDGTDKADKWPRIPKDGTWSDESIEAFLTRVKETPHQLNLGLK